MAHNSKSHDAPWLPTSQTEMFSVYADYSLAHIPTPSRRSDLKFILNAPGCTFLCISTELSLPTVRYQWILPLVFIDKTSYSSSSISFTSCMKPVFAHFSVARSDAVAYTRLSLPQLTAAVILCPDGVITRRRFLRRFSNDGSTVWSVCVFTDGNGLNACYTFVKH